MGRRLGWRMRDYRGRPAFRAVTAKSRQKKMRITAPLFHQRDALASLAGVQAEIKPESALLGVGTAPAFASDLLARENGAIGIGIGRLALVERAVGAVLAGCEFGEFGFIDLAGVFLVAKGCGLRVRLGDFGLGKGLARNQTANGNGWDDLEHELSARLHINYS